MNLGTAIFKAIADFSPVKRESAEASRALNDLQGSADRTQSKVGSVFSTIGKAAGVLTGVVSGIFAAATLKKGYDRLTTIQDATGALTVQFQDAGKAAAFMAEIVKVVTGTPFNLDQFAAAGARLVGFGVDANKVPHYLTAIGEAAARMGKEAPDYADRLSTALGRIASSGRVGMEEVNQFSEAGVNALVILGNHFGVTTQEARKMVEKGTMPAQESIDALADGILNGSTGVAGATVALTGTMANLRKTLSGSAGGFKTAVARFGANVISPFTGSLTTLFTQGAQILDAGGKTLNTWLTRLVQSPGFQTLTTKVADAVTRVVDWLGRLNTVDLSGFAQAFSVISTILNPASLILKGIAPVLPAIADAFSSIATAIGTALAPVLPGFVDLIGQIATLLAQGLATVLPVILTLLTNLTPVIAPLVETLGGLVLTLLQGLLPILTPLLPIIGQIATILADGLAAVLPVITTAVQTLAPAFGQLITALAPLLTAILTPLVPLVQAMVDAFVGMLPSLQPLIPAVLDLVNAMLPMLPPLIQIAQTLLPALVDVFGQLWPILAQLIPVLVQALIPALQIMQWIITTFVVPALQAFATWLQQGDNAKNLAGVLFSLTNTLLVLAIGFGKAVAAIRDFVSGAIDALYRFGQSAGQTLSNVGAWFAGLPGRISAALGNLGSLLYGAGRSIMSGLLSGITAGFQNVKNFVSGIGSWISSHKGPKEYDLRLLVPNGRWIVQGLGKGLEQGIPGLQDNIGTVTSAIQGALGTPFNVNAAMAGKPNVPPVLGTSAAALPVSPQPAGSWVIEKVEINNPTPEPASDSLPAAIRRVSYVGVPGA